MRVFRKNFNSAFTLIELLVVVAIIGVLASVVLSSLSSARAKGRDAKRAADIRSFQTALEFYYNDFGYYPLNSWVHSTDATWQTSSFASALDPYLPTLPVDPTNDTCCGHNGGYVYSYYSSGYRAPGQTNQQWYMLVFRYENQSHSAQTTDGVYACGNNLNALPATFFHYGTGSNGIITIGGSCV